MLEEFAENHFEANMSDPGMRADRFFSVEIRPSGLIPVYKFKLRKSSSNEVYILVKEGSAILGFLKSGQELNATYSTEEQTGLGAALKTKINYIIKEIQGRFKGHHMVGLSPI